MSTVENTVITTFTNGMGSVKLAKVASVFVVTFEPRYGENVTLSHHKRKRAEIDYSHHVNTLVKGA